MWILAWKFLDAILYFLLLRSCRLSLYQITSNGGVPESSHSRLTSVFLRVSTTGGKLLKTGGSVKTRISNELGYFISHNAFISLFLSWKKESRYYNGETVSRTITLVWRNNCFGEAISFYKITLLPWQRAQTRTLGVFTEEFNLLSAWPYEFILDDKDWCKNCKQKPNPSTFNEDDLHEV